MGLTGDFAALAQFYTKLKKLPEASREIAKALAPKTEKLVGETFSAQASPEGAPWPATKSGAPAFGGGDAGGRVLSRLVGKATVRTTILYPLHFHQDGTHKVGRKRASIIRKAIVGAAARLAVADIVVPRKRKDESEFDYQQRVAKAMARRAARKEAVQATRHRVAFAVQEARTAGGYHDPPRPMIPDEGGAIPPTWVTAIRETARAVMAKYGATEAR